MKKIARIGLRLAGWLVTLAVLAGVLGAVALMVGPRLLRWQAVIVLSGSMQPALKVGGLAFVDSTVDAASVEVGDIITYRSVTNPKKQISHRVIEVINDDGGLHFRTKGDASQLPDQQSVPAGNLIGKVRFQVPYLGYAADKLRHRDNFYLLLGIPGGLLVANELYNIFRQVRRRREAEC